MDSQGHLMVSQRERLLSLVGLGDVYSIPRTWYGPPRELVAVLRWWHSACQMHLGIYAEASSFSRLCASTTCSCVLAGTCS